MKSLIHSFRRSVGELATGGKFYFLFLCVEREERRNHLGSEYIIVKTFFKIGVRMRWMEVVGL